MRYVKNGLILFVMAIMFAGCVTMDAGRGKPVTLAAPVDKNMGMIVGRVDDRESKHKITYVTIWEIKTKARGGNKGLPVRMFPDGTFVAVNLKPGRYFIPLLTSEDEWAGVLGEPYKALEVKPGKVTYWGSYKAIYKRGIPFLGILPRVKLTKNGKQERKKVFETVLKSAKGTPWEKVIKKSM